MGKKNILFNLLFSIGLLIAIFIVVFLLAISLQFNLEDALFAVGVSGIIGLFSMFILGFVINKKNIDKDIDTKQHEYYVSLVEKAEADSKAFDKRMIRISHLGNFYIIGLLLLIMLSFMGAIMIGIKMNVHSMGGLGAFFAGLVGVSYIIIKSLYIKPDEIDGTELTIEEYPNIHRIINNALSKTNGSQIDKVYAYPDNNCAVLTTSTGFAGRTQNILLLGLHILEMVNDSELESILVHELAHIYNKDTVISNKLNNNITRWTKILESSQLKGFIASYLLTPFANFYIVLMQMHLSAISKQNEYIADSEASKYLGKNVYFTASAKIELLHYFFNKISDEKEVDLRTYEIVPDNYYNILFDNFYKQYEINKVEWQNQIVKSISTRYDSHPSFSERMKAIGIDNFKFDLKFQEEKSYDSELQKLFEIFNKEWHDLMSEVWSEYRQDYIKSKELVDNFTTTDDLQTNYEYGMALETLCRFDDALAFYNDLLNKYPDNEVALFRKGLLLITKNDESGIELVKKAMDLNSDFIEVGLQSIGEFLNANGMIEKKEELMEWATKMSQVYDKKMDEITNIYTNDEFTPAKIEADKLIKLKEGLSEIPEIKKAYLVTKEFKLSTGYKLVLAITHKGEYFKKYEELTKILETIDITCDIVDLNIDLYFTKPISSVENAEIYKKGN